jgi:signal peptidase I
MRQRPLGCLFEVVETLVLTLVIFLVIQNFVAQPYLVQQMSMEHSLEPGDYVLVDKLTPRFDDYSRGDVVVFHPPAGYDQGDGTPFIKRVIGLPGDHIVIRDGRVTVNGTTLTEPYLFEDQPTSAPPDRSEWTIPPGELFVLGDHRELSQDSRVFGPVKRDSVIGRAWLRYWPFAGFGVLPTPTYEGITLSAP